MFIALNQPKLRDKICNVDIVAMMFIRQLEKDDKITPDSMGWEHQFLSMSELEDTYFSVYSLVADLSVEDDLLLKQCCQSRIWNLGLCLGSH